MSVLPSSVTCSDCGRERNESTNSCECGATRRTFSIFLSDTLKVRDELRGTVRDQDQSVAADFSVRTDDIRNANASIDYRAGTINVGGKQDGHVDKDEEQAWVLGALAAELSRINGCEYGSRLDASDQEADGWLWAKDTSDTCQAMQLRHLDDEAIKTIQRTRSLKDSFTFQDLFQAAEKAINDKARKYPVAVKQNMWLVIHTPYPIMDSFIEQMRLAVSDVARRSGFREVWVVPFREPPFRLDA